MEEDNSVTVWLRQISEGNQEAAQQLWHRYSSVLCRLVRTRYGGAVNAVANEEDLVQSVFRALWSGAVAGKWDSVRDRSELWWLLLAITRNKAVKRRNFNTRQKRGGVISEPDANTKASFGVQPEDRASDEPPPDLILMMQEEQDRLLAMLRDDVLRNIAVWKLDGYTHEEIAVKLGVAPRTVIRKLNLVRDTWSQELKS